MINFFNPYLPLVMVLNYSNNNLKPLSTICLSLYSFNRLISGILIPRIKNLSSIKIIVVYDDADTKNKNENIDDM